MHCPHICASIAGSSAQGRIVSTTLQRKASLVSQACRFADDECVFGFGMMDGGDWVS